MKTITYLQLKALHARHGPRVFGKICQKLVALAFRHGGCTHVVERGVQGVDIDAAWETGLKYSTEIKTTSKNFVAFGKKDVLGLASRRQDGYHPVLGVLKLSPLSDWFLLDATGLDAGSLVIDKQRPRRIVEVECRLRPFFDQVLECHFDRAMLAGPNHLDQLLRSAGVKTTDS